MKPINIEAMKDIALQAHELGIIHEYGEAGSQALRDLLESIIKLYTYINPEVIKKSLANIPPRHQCRNS